MAVKDKFPNMAVIQLTESAANTLTFKKLESGISLFEKVAWIVHRVEYLLQAADYANMNSSGDLIEMAICATDQIATLSPVNAAIIDYRYHAREDFGAAASGLVVNWPIVTDFSTLPMGGVIVPPNPIYLAIKGTGCGAVMKVTARFFYTTYQMAADDYWELVEARRIISST